MFWSTLEFGSSSPSSLLRLFLRGWDFLLHLISFVLSFSILICCGYLGNFGKNPSCINKLICIINLMKIGEIWLNSWNWGIHWLSGVVGLFKSLTFWIVDIFIFSLEITVLGYRWRIVVLVVDSACGLGITESNHWLSHLFWLLN